MTTQRLAGLVALLLLLVGAERSQAAVTLVWEYTPSPSVPVSGFLLERRTVPGGLYQPLVTVPGAQTLTATDPQVLPLGTRLAAPPLTVFAVDSEETGGEHWLASLAIDGNPATFWHTEWLLRAPPVPHALILDMGGEAWVDGLEYVPRQDGWLTGTMTAYEVALSSDQDTWTVISQGTWVPDTTPKQTRFARTLTRFVRLTALAEAQGFPYTTVAEVTVFGYPVGTIGTGTLPPTYCYQVRAIAVVGLSVPSNELCVEAPGLSTPTLRLR